MIAFLKSNPRFFRFWLAGWASEIGDWVRNITMMFLVLDLSNGSAMSLSINLFCEFAPIFLFGLFVGALADRWNRQRTIMGAILFRAIIMVFLILAYLAGSLLLIYVCGFVSAIGTLFFRSANQSFLMLFVEGVEERKTATAMRQTATSSVQLLGPTAGASFYLMMGAGGSLAITIFMFLVAVFLVSTIRVEQPEMSTKRTFAGIWKDVQDGFRYSWSNPYVRPILFTNMIYGFAAGIINVLEVFIITDFLGLPKEWMALLATVQGAGMLVGSLFVNKLKLSLHRMMPVGLIVVGVFLAGMVAFRSFYATAASLVLFSFGMIMVTFGMQAMKQIKVEFAYQGRAGMSMSSAFNGFMVVTMLASGWLAKLYTIRPVIVLAGLAATLSGLILYTVFQRNLRQEQMRVSANSEVA
ncbi:MFS transporter [Tumebacillus flagellatus]|uniref:Major facilitator superfamily (MFS) profile domain-containing protein n=1 Tax=Tumebacillus flagellatus TaxID=1157490 RepID=A0A074LUG2_9BACL|nr:MFS transporter [Tumebacillus flagellatus]KEO83573.1 hypothetical protein EL26_09175 [Tumebacillus flagellatus]